MPAAEEGHVPGASGSHDGGSEPEHGDASTEPGCPGGDGTKYPVPGAAAGSGQQRRSIVQSVAAVRASGPGESAARQQATRAEAHAAGLARGDAAAVAAMEESMRRMSPAGARFDASRQSLPRGVREEGGARATDGTAKHPVPQRTGVLSMWNPAGDMRGVEQRRAWTRGRRGRRGAGVSILRGVNRSGICGETRVPRGVEGLVRGGATR